MRSLFLVCLALALAGGCASTPQSLSAKKSPDILIVNGTIIDGTGAPGRAADVLIREGRIAAVSEPGALKSEAKGATIIDAAGKVVTPGFIDAHAHGDPLETPDLHNFLAMGVTTICLGQDGSHPGGKNPGEWMTRVDAIQPGANIALFVGHGTVREEAGVGRSKNPSPEQIAAMQALVREAMEQGCFGLSTGLEYLPGLYSDTAELAAIAKPVAEHGGLVSSHMRSEDNDQIAAALKELLTQGREAGCPVHVSHIKVVYGRGVARAVEILSLLEVARESGQKVTADIYPYTASYTGIAIVFPEWAKSRSGFEEAKQTRRDELATYLRERVTLRNGPEATLFGTGKFAGKTLAQVAEELGKPFEDVLIDDIGPGGASAAYFVMDEALQARLLVDPNIMICSDGSPDGAHPRGHGAFARVIRKFVIEEKRLTLEEAVRKMSGLTAATIGIQDRGVIAEGKAADILIFDPAAVRDTATYENSRQLAEGFDWVIVNGAIVRAKGEFSGMRAGQMLRK